MFVAGDGGRRENPFFLRDALDEFTFESEAQFRTAVVESGITPQEYVYDAIKLQALFTKMGVRVATLKTLFAKPSQDRLVANIFATMASVTIFGIIGFYYKFAQEYRIYRLQQYILKLIHSDKFADVLKTKDAQRDTLLQRLLDPHKTVQTDPKFVKYMAKFSGGKAEPSSFFGGVGGAGRGGGGGDAGGARGGRVVGGGGRGGGGGARGPGTPPRRVDNLRARSDAAPAFEAIIAEQANLGSALENVASVNADKAVRAKAARKRSSLFALSNEGGAAAGGGESAAGGEV
jgi:hypothetical protein